MEHLTAVVCTGTTVFLLCSTIKHQKSFHVTIESSYSTVVYMDKSSCVSTSTGMFKGLTDLNGLETLINQDDGYFNSDPGFLSI